MAPKVEPARESAERELKITRVFDAPREVVFKAWTDPKLLAQWWGPKGFTNPVCELDARPGGAIRVHMRGPDGTVYPMGGMFHEIVEPERIVFTSTAHQDEAGEPQLEVFNTVTFAEHNGKDHAHAARGGCEVGSGHRQGACGDGAGVDRNPGAAGTVYLDRQVNEGRIGGLDLRNEKDEAARTSQLGNLQK